MQERARPEAGRARQQAAWHDTDARERDIDGIMVSGACVVLVAAYQLEMRPRLDHAGLTCEEHDFSSLINIVIAMPIAFHVLAVCACAIKPRAAYVWKLRWSLPPLILFGIAAASLKIAFLVANYGVCGLFELHWYLIYGMLRVMPDFFSSFSRRHRQSRQQTRGPQVDQLLVLLETIEWADEQHEAGSQCSQDQDADAQCASTRKTATDTQCAICLADFEPRDIIKVTLCNHSFHERCLKDWLVHRACQTRTLSCVLCRRNLFPPRRGDACEVSV